MWKDYQETDWDNWEYDENGDSHTSQDEEETLVFKDAHWNLLSEWDTIAAIKDIKVKWAKDIKRWDKFTKIKFTDDADLVESGKMVLRCEFFKRI